MTDTQKKSGPPPISPAVEQAARLLLCLGKNKEKKMGLTQICKEIGIHKSKGLSILNSLVQNDFITKNMASKSYSLGPALIPLAMKAVETLDIHGIAKDELQAFADTFGSTVLLGIICNDRFYVSDKYDGNDALSITVRPHQSLHITHGAHGKAILAFLPSAKQKKMLSSAHLDFYGKGSAIDKKFLEMELRECRKNGYAIDPGMTTPGINAVAAPVFNHQNEVFASIVVVGTFPEERFPEIGKKTADLARNISRLSGARI